MPYLDRIQNNASFLEWWYPWKSVGPTGTEQLFSSVHYILQFAALFDKWGSQTNQAVFDTLQRSYLDHIPILDYDTCQIARLCHSVQSE